MHTLFFQNILEILLYGYNSNISSSPTLIWERTFQVPIKSIKITQFTVKVYLQYSCYSDIKIHQRFFWLLFLFVFAIEQQDSTKSKSRINHASCNIGFSSRLTDDSGSHVIIIFIQHGIGDGGKKDCCRCGGNTQRRLYIKFP